MSTFIQNTFIYTKIHTHSSSSTVSKHAKKNVGVFYFQAIL